MEFGLNTFDIACPHAILLYWTYKSGIKDRLVQHYFRTITPASIITTLFYNGDLLWWSPVVAWTVACILSLGLYLLPNTYQHIEAETIWPTFSRWHFQIQKTLREWKKMYEFRLRFHRNLFLWYKLTIFQHWFRKWLGTDQATSHYLNLLWLVYWRIYASLGLNDLTPLLTLTTLIKAPSVDINLIVQN